MDQQQKIQLIFEAINKTKGEFTELVNSLNGVSSSQSKLNIENRGIIQSMKENWLALSAAVAAAGAAIYKALEYMEIAAKDQQAEVSFRSVAAAAGENADSILAAMDRAANGTIDASDIMQKAVKGLTQGLSGDQLVQIMEAARVQARRAGIDVKDAYEQIVDAIANNNTKALRMMGILSKDQMKLFEANMALGAREVSLFALVMANAADQSAMMGPILEDNSEKLQKLAAWWKDVKKTIGEAIWDLISAIKSLVTGSVDVVMGLLSGAITGIMGLFLLAEIGLNKLGLRSDEVVAKTQEDFDKLKKISSDFFSSAFGAEEKSPVQIPQSKPGGKNAASYIEAQMREILSMRTREADINQQLSDIEGQEKNLAISRLDAVRDRISLEEKLLEIQTESLSHINKLENPQGWIQQANAINETRRKLIDLNLTLKEQTGSIFQGVSFGFTKFVAEAKTAFQHGAQIAQETAQAMQQAFSDFFFDAITGKLKSLSDYLTSFLNSIARAVSNALAGQLVSGLMSGLGYAPGGGGPPVSPYGPPPQLHAGGYIPRFHIGGLSSDERAAVLQTGEYVVSRKGVAALDRINKGEAAGGNVNVAVTIENQTGRPVDAQASGAKFDGEKYVVSVVMKNYEQGGALRNLLSGAR